VKTNEKGEALVSWPWMIVYRLMQLCAIVATCLLAWLFITLAIALAHGLK